MLLLHGFGFDSGSTAFGFWTLSSVFEAANGASVVGETRLGWVPMALEIESKGLIGRETGNEGVRREIGDTLSPLLLLIQVVPLIDVKLRPPAGVRAIVPEERARLVGIVVNTGSTSSFSSRMLVERSSCDEEEDEEQEREDMLNAEGFALESLEIRGDGGLPESVIDDEGVLGDSSAEDEQSESALSELNARGDVLRGARRLAGSVIVVAGRNGLINVRQVEFKFGDDNVVVGEENIAQKSSGRRRLVKKWVDVDASKG